MDIAPSKRVSLTTKGGVTRTGEVVKVDDKRVTLATETHGVSSILKSEIAVVDTA